MRKHGELIENVTQFYVKCDGGEPFHRPPPAHHRSSIFQLTHYLTHLLPFLFNMANASNRIINYSTFISAVTQHKGGMKVPALG